MNLTGSVILITGGTGSFGNRVATHLLKSKPAQIRSFSRDEKKQWERQRGLGQFNLSVDEAAHHSHWFSAWSFNDAVSRTAEWHNERHAGNDLCLQDHSLQQAEAFQKVAADNKSKWAI
jgi:NAD(P)-dependent dehydrogenase (short-subunit alcohol dehydrogenase family)